MSKNYYSQGANTVDRIQDNSTRYHGLDALRALAMGLGIVLHAALPYVPNMPAEIWPTDDNSSSLIAWIFHFIHIWRMPLFFMLSGFFASLLTERNSWRYWWKNRLLRILLPLMVFSPLMSATLPSIFRYGITADLTYFYSNEGQPYHLWFLWHLLIFVVFSFIYKSAGYICYRILKVVHAGMLLRAFYNIKSFVTRVVFQSKYPVILIGVFVLFNLATGGELIINPIASGLYFYLGFSLYNDKTLLLFMRSHWKSYLCAGLVIFAGHQGVYSQIDPFLPPHDPVWKIWGLPLVFLKVGAAVLLSFSLIGFVEDKLGKFNSMTRYMSDASYWMYLVHLPIVTFISFFMFNINLPIELKFLLSVAITVVACLVTYKYLVRNTLLGLMLNGRRY